VIAARTVERGKNPEDGTDEGLATLVLRTGGSAAVAVKWAPGVVVSAGARNPREADPELTNAFLVPSTEAAEKERGRQRRDRL